MYLLYGTVHQTKKADVTNEEIQKHKQSENADGQTVKTVC